MFRVILGNWFNFSVLYPPSSHHHKPCLGKHKAASIFQHSKLEEIDSQRQMTMESSLYHGALPLVSAPRFSLSPSGKCQVFFSLYVTDFLTVQIRQVKATRNFTPHQEQARPGANHTSPTHILSLIFTILTHPISLTKESLGHWEDMDSNEDRPGLDKGSFGTFGVWCRNALRTRRRWQNDVWGWKGYKLSWAKDPKTWLAQPSLAFSSFSLKK